MKHIKLFFLLFSITCFSNIKSSDVNNSVADNSNSNRYIAKRTTSSYRSSVAYSKHFITDNSITGTGNKLKDITYNSLCNTLKCTTGCCEGILNIMYCGVPENCVKYRDYERFVTIMVYFSVAWGVLLIISIWGSKYCDKSCTPFFSYMLIILCLPLSLIICICWCIKSKIDCTKSESNPENKEIELDIKGIVDKKEEIINNNDIQDQKVNNEVGLNNTNLNNLNVKNEVEVLDQPYSHIVVNQQGQVESNIIQVNNINNNNNQMFESGNYPAFNEIKDQKEDNAAPIS